MTEERMTNQLTKEWLEGNLSVIRLMIGVIAIRAGVAESLMIVLNKTLETTRPQAEPSQEENKTISEELFQEGSGVAIAQMKDLLDALISQFKSPEKQATKQKVFVQTTNEDIVASILVTQVALAQLSSHLNLSNTLKDNLGSARISYESSNPTGSNEIAMTEESTEIQSAIKQLQRVLNQMND